MQVHLPPLAERYGERLQIVGVDVASPGGGRLFQATIDHFGLIGRRRGVPTLVLGEEVLVGSLEIPTRLPEIVEHGLASGGIPWPEVPLVREALVQQGILQAPEHEPPQGTEEPVVGSREAEETVAGATEVEEKTAAGATEAEEEPAAGRTNDPADEGAIVSEGAGPAPVPAPEAPGGSTTAAEAPGDLAGGATLLDSDAMAVAHSLTAGQRFLLDPAGNGLAVVVLLVMVAVLVLALAQAAGSAETLPRLPSGLVPALGALGIAVAAYLAWVEITGTEAVCGPVGDCNTVQQSEYARLFGLLPVGLLGVAGYAVMLGTWVLAEAGPGRWRERGWRALWAMALAGTEFSVYLTFLEPFVIGATCAWCVTSAVVVTALLVVATPRVAPGGGRTAGASPPPA
jgi:uncharacterized membrane protein